MTLGVVALHSKIKTMQGNYLKTKQDIVHEIDLNLSCNR